MKLGARNVLTCVAIKNVTSLQLSLDGSSHSEVVASNILKISNSWSDFQYSPLACGIHIGVAHGGLAPHRVGVSPRICHPWTSLVSQPCSVLQIRSLSVSACVGIVWILRTTLCGSLWEFE